MADDPKQQEVSPSDLSAMWGQAESNPPPVSPAVAPKMREPEPPVASPPASVFEEEPIPPPPPGAPIEGEVVEEESEVAPESIFEDEPQEAASKLDQLLAEIHLTKKHLFLFLGLGVVLIIGLVFGVKFLFGLVDSGDEGAGQKKIVTVSEGKEKISSVTAPQEPVGMDASLRSVLYFGRSFFLPPYFFSGADIDLSLLVGSLQKENQSLGKYVVLLRRLQNAYGTDITSLLNKSVDRRSVLQNHLTFLKRLSEEARVARDQIQFQKNELKKSLDALEKKRDEEEKQFFDALKDLQPRSESFLSQYIKDAKDALALKAQLQALDRLSKFYESALSRVEARVKDIELNAEALIKGIKVFDVPGSDLKIIEPLKASE